MERVFRWAVSLSIVAMAGAVIMAVSALPAYARQALPPAPGMANETPEPLKEVGITEHLGDQIDLDLQFKDETGALVPLRSFFKDHKPVLLSLAYYSCPSLCNFHLNGLRDVFKALKAPLGHDFNAVVVSIDPRETPELAANKKTSYIESYGRPEGAEGWHFLVGEDANIKKLAEQVGFRYRWDEDEKQWAHAAAAYVITPDGKISRYLYGIEFSPQTLRLSMIEASNGRIGNIVDKLILFCFHFDPKASKYTIYAFNVMRVGGGMVALLIMGYLALFWVRSRRENSIVNGGGDGPRFQT